MGKQMRPSSNEPNEEEMREALEAIKRSMDQQQGDIASILLALRGNQEMGHTGLIHRVEEQGKKIEKHEKIILWGGGFIVAAGIIWDVIKDKIKSNL